MDVCPNKSSTKEEAKRDITPKNDKQVQNQSKENSFDESSDELDFGTGGYVPSFACGSTEPKHETAKEDDGLEEIMLEDFEGDDTDATSMAKQRPASSGKNGT